jgi:hypothetical protein
VEWFALTYPEFVIRPAGPKRQRGRPWVLAPADYEAARAEALAKLDANPPRKDLREALGLAERTCRRYEAARRATLARATRP